MAVLRKLQEELTLMAAVSEMPYVTGNKMPFCSRHKDSKKNGLFAPEKVNIGLF